MPPTLGFAVIVTQPKLGTFLGRSRLLKYTRVPLTIVRPKDLQSITNTPGSGGGGGGSSSGDCCGRYGVSGGGWRTHLWRGQWRLSQFRIFW